jgi:hypothetical protein
LSKGIYLVSVETIFGFNYRTKLIIEWYNFLNSNLKYLNNLLKAVTLLRH